MSTASKKLSKSLRNAAIALCIASCAVAFGYGIAYSRSSLITDMMGGYQVPTQTNINGLCGACHNDWTGSQTRNNLGVAYYIYDNNSVTANDLAAAAKALDGDFDGATINTELVNSQTAVYPGAATKWEPGHPDKDGDGCVQLYYRTDENGMPVQQLVITVNGVVGTAKGYLNFVPGGWDIDDNDGAQGCAAWNSATGPALNPGTTTDVTPPDAITDLRAGSLAASSLPLTWTAVGDDGATGTAYSYDIRYTTDALMAAKLYCDGGACRVRNSAHWTTMWDMPDCDVDVSAGVYLMKSGTPGAGSTTPSCTVWNSGAAGAATVGTALMRALYEPTPVAPGSANSYTISAKGDPLAPPWTPLPNTIVDGTTYWLAIRTWDGVLTPTGFTAVGPVEDPTGFTENLAPVSNIVAITAGTAGAAITSYSPTITAPGAGFTVTINGFGLDNTNASQVVLTDKSGTVVSTATFVNTGWPNTTATATFPATVPVGTYTIETRTFAGVTKTAWVDALRVAAYSTATGTLTLTPANKRLDLLATYTNDANSNNSCSARYRVSPAGAWSGWTAMTNDRSLQQCTIAFIGLTNGTTYDVEVSFADANTVIGTNPLTGTNLVNVGTVVNSYTTAGTYTWTVGYGISSAAVECWGGGGGGGGAASGNGRKGGGGGGGEYAKKAAVPVIAGTDYTIVVGAGGAGGLIGSNNGANGGSSTFGGTTVVANGGLGGCGNGNNCLGLGNGSGGTGGTGGTGDVGSIFNGGAGSNGGNTTIGGAGGGGAGSTAVGGTASLNVAGAAGPDGTRLASGAGATGLSATGNGLPGNQAGGGGGGGLDTGWMGAQAGGVGGAGRCDVSYPEQITPRVFYPVVANITSTTALLGATITDGKGETVTQRGTCWATAANPTTNCSVNAGSWTAPPNVAFSESRTGLTAGTRIFYRGYGESVNGRGYSADGSFYTEPATQASAVNFTSVLDTSMTVNWTRGSGDGVIVIMRQGAAPTGVPIDGTYTGYVGNAAFGTGTEVDTGSFVVYKGTATSVNVTGLTGSSVYYVAVYEYAGIVDTVNNDYGTNYKATPATGSQASALTPPGFQAAGTSVNDATGGGTVTLSWPAHQTNDIGLLIIESNAGEAITFNTTTGSGPCFNGTGGGLVATVNNASGTQLAVYWCRATSGAMGTVAFNQPPVNHLFANILTFRNIGVTGNPWDVMSTGSTGTTATVTINGATTTMPNDLVVLISTSGRMANSTAEFNTWTNANLSGLTERFDQTVNTNGGGGFGVATGTKAAAGAYGNSTVTITAGSYAAISIALKPTNATPNVPSALVQKKSGGTALAQDTWLTPAEGNTVRFEGTVSDSDAGDTLSLQVDVDSNNVAEACTTTTTAPGSGGTAVTTCSGLADGTYNWQARTSDGSVQSNWVAKTGETSFDFGIDTTGPAYTWSTPATTDWYKTGSVVSVSAGLNDGSGRGITNGVACNAKVDAATNFTGSATYASTTTTTGTCSGNITLGAGFTTGAHNLTVSVTDTNGNTTTSANRSFGIDNTVPTDVAGFTLTNVIGGCNLSWIADTDAHSGMSTSDAYKLVYTVSPAAAPAANCSTGTDIAAVTTGLTYNFGAGGSTAVHNFMVCGIDAVGNVSAGKSGTCTPQANAAPVKTAAPMVQYKTDGTTVIGNNTWTNQNQIVVKGTATDANGHTYNLEVEIIPSANAYTNTANCSGALVASNTLASTGNCTTGGLADGSYKWQYRFVDQLGMGSTWAVYDAVTPNVKIDTTAPTTTATATGYTFGNWSLTSPISVTLSANDGTGSGVAASNPVYCVDTTDTCTPATVYSAAFNVTCAAGSTCTQYVRYKATDAVGNAETVKSSIVRQDIQAPTDAALNAANGNNQCTLSWSSSDSGSGMHATEAYKLVRGAAGAGAPANCTGTDLTGNSTASSYIDTGVLNGNTYGFRLCSIDALGNQSTGITVSCTPTANALPAAVTDLSVVNSAVRALSLKWTEPTDADGTIASYEFKYVDAYDYAANITTATLWTNGYAAAKEPAPSNASGSVTSFPISCADNGDNVTCVGAGAPTVAQRTSCQSALCPNTLFYTTMKSVDNLGASSNYSNFDPTGVASSLNPSANSHGTTKVSHTALKYGWNYVSVPYAWDGVKSYLNVFDDDTGTSAGSTVNIYRWDSTSATNPTTSYNWVSVANTTVPPATANQTGGKGFLISSPNYKAILDQYNSAGTAQLGANAATWIAVPLEPGINWIGNPWLKNANVNTMYICTYTAANAAPAYAAGVCSGANYKATRAFTAAQAVGDGMVGTDVYFMLGDSTFVNESHTTAKLRPWWGVGILVNNAAWTNATYGAGGAAPVDPDNKVWLIIVKP